MFVTNVKIGSNKQQFNLLVDTGSLSTWVVNKGSVDNQYKISNHYDPSTSNTSKNSNILFSLVYGSGRIFGTYYSDIFNYINNKDFQMFFGVANKTEFISTLSSIDGIIGLGHFYSDEKSSFIKMLNRGGVTNSMLFSLKFGSSIYVGAKGTLYIGKHEDFSKKNVVSCPIVNSGKNIYWECQINSLGFKYSGNEIKTNKKYNFIFDSGCNNLLLPLEFKNDIENSIQKFNCQFEEYLYDETLFRLVCENKNNVPDLKLEINGYYLIIPSKYIFFLLENDKYYSNFYFQKRDYYIIGSIFFFAFHTLFDKENEKLFFYPENNETLIKKNYIDIDIEEDEKRQILFDKYNFLNLCILIGLILLSIGTGILLYYVIKNRKKNNKKEIIIPSNNYENTFL